MAPSQLLRKQGDQTPFLSAANAIISLAKKCNYGEKDPYNFRQGVGEFSREFSHAKVPFGYYKIKGNEVIFINESEVRIPEHQTLLAVVAKRATEAPGIFVLLQGEVSSLTKEREPFFEVHKRDHEEI